MKQKNMGIIMRQMKVAILVGMNLQKEIFRQAVEMGRMEYAEDNVSVIPVTTEEYGISKAKRPFNSKLDKRKLLENGFKPQDALKRYLRKIEF